MQMNYLSPSRLSRFAQCALSFKFKYIDPPSWEDETTEWYGSYGSLMHELLEKMAKGELSADAATHLYYQHYRYCGIPADQHENYYSSGIGALQQKGTELDKLRPNIIGVELKFNEMLDFTIPPLHGFIDLVYQDEFGLVVRDYKTSRVYDSTIMKKQLQPYIYSLVCKSIYGKHPYKFEFDFIRFGEIKSVLIDDNFIKLGEIKVRNYWNKILKSNFPATYSPFYCANFCEYRSICPEFQKKIGYRGK